MHQKEENLTVNHTIPMVSEMTTKESTTNEENSRLFMNSILLKGKNEGRSLKPEKSLRLCPETSTYCTFMNSISASYREIILL
jgi:hypothetical protein